jgi:hypothetical protein
MQDMLVLSSTRILRLSDDAHFVIAVHKAEAYRRLTTSASIREVHVAVTKG